MLIQVSWILVTFFIDVGVGCGEEESGHGSFVGTWESVLI